MSYEQKPGLDPAFIEAIAQALAERGYAQDASRAQQSYGMLNDGSPNALQGGVVNDWQPTDQDDAGLANAMYAQSGLGGVDQGYGPRGNPLFDRPSFENVSDVGGINQPDMDIANILGEGLVGTPQEDYLAGRYRDTQARHFKASDGNVYGYWNPNDFPGGTETPYGQGHPQGDWNSYGPPGEGSPVVSTVDFGDESNYDPHAADSIQGIKTTPKKKKGEFSEFFQLLQKAKGEDGKGATRKALKDLAAQLSEEEAGNAETTIATS